MLHLRIAIEPGVFSVILRLPAGLKGLNVNILKRSMLSVAAIGAAGAIVAGGSVPALAATSSGVRYMPVQNVSLNGSGGECDAIVLSAAVSTGKPAYASVAVLNSLTGSCTGWAERSVNNGAWKNVSAKETAAGGTGWFKTANYYAGPGNRVRGCIQVGKKVSCSVPVSLPKSSAKPANDAVAPGYAKTAQFIGSSSSGGCEGILSGSTKSKAKTSRANLILMDAGYSCSGWLEVSTNKGKTWSQATQTYSVAALAQFAFSTSAADGSGRLVRACLKRGSAAKRCSSSW